jgi:cytochrome P450
MKRNPVAFLSFGIGPKNCIGMKFALMELKMALVKLIVNYEILPSKNTPESLKFRESPIRQAVNGVSVILKKRNKSQSTA